jgi:cysteine desulfurase
MTQEIERLSYLRDLLENHLTTKLSHTFINGDRAHRTCNTTNICFDYTDSTALVMALDLKGVACSNGSACASGNPEPSHVLLAMGLPQHQAHASLRFSLGHSTTESEIQQACEIIPPVVSRLRESHPMWKKAG